jgi:hypothetical protein
VTTIKLTPAQSKAVRTTEPGAEIKAHGNTVAALVRLGLAKMRDRVGYGFRSNWYGVLTPEGEQARAAMWRAEPSESWEIAEGHMRDIVHGETREQAQEAAAFRMRGRGPYTLRQLTNGEVCAADQADRADRAARTKLNAFAICSDDAHQLVTAAEVRAEQQIAGDPNAPLIGDRAIWESIAATVLELADDPAAQQMQAQYTSIDNEETAEARYVHDGSQVFRGREGEVWHTVYTVPAPLAQLADFEERDAEEFDPSPHAEKQDWDSYAYWADQIAEWAARAGMPMDDLEAIRAAIQKWGQTLTDAERDAFKAAAANAGKPLTLAELTAIARGEEPVAARS